MARAAVVLIFSSDEVEFGDHYTAIDYLRRALRLSPLDPRIFYAHNGLAFAHFFLGNYEEGLKCAADALRHHLGKCPIKFIASFGIGSEQIFPNCRAVSMIDHLQRPTLGASLDSIDL